MNSTTEPGSGARPGALRDAPRRAREPTGSLRFNRSTDGRGQEEGRGFMELQNNSGVAHWLHRALPYIIQQRIQRWRPGGCLTSSVSMWDPHATELIKHQICPAWPGWGGVCVRVRVCARVHACVCVCVCAHACVCVWASL